MAEPVTPVKTPEWLLLLEKKKNRPHRLAHEIGAGSPCLLCGEKCPGLDLHFWRKLCRNCKCKKEDHDVKDEDGYAQFEILLGAGGKQKKLGAVLKLNVPEVSKDVAGNKSLPFDWVPPNVSEDVAAEYMEQLPSAKLPISGSDGALYRKQQLERQVPLHDLDASRCHNLTPREIEQLQKYLDNLKNNVVGQGRVTKVPTLYTEQRHCYRGPDGEQNSSHQVPMLPSSRSEQSLRSMPPLHPSYNAVPRPFLHQPNNEELPPPLPTSLPPNEIGSRNLKTPSSFVPHKIIQDKNSSECVSSQDYHNGVQCATKPLSNQLDADFAQLHLAADSTQYQGSDVALKDGTKSFDQLPSNVVHSAQASGHLTPAMAQALQGRGNLSKPVASGLPMSGTVGGTSSRLFPNHGSVVHSIHCQSISSSASAPGLLGPEMSHPLPPKGSSLPCNCGGSTVHSIQPQDAAPSSSLLGPLGSGSTAHSIQPQDAASSSSLLGPLGSEMSRPLPVKGFSVPFHYDGSTVHSIQPHDSVSSASVPGLGPGMSCTLPANGSSVPHHYDGSTTHFNPPQNVVSSSSAPGQTSPAYTQPLLLRNSGNQLPGSIAESTVPGKQNTRAADNSCLIPNDPLELQESYEPWDVNNQMPAPSHHEYTFRPQYDVSFSSDVNGDALPRSAHIIQHSKPDDSTLSSHMNQPAQEQHVKSHLSCHHCKQVLMAGDVAVFADRAGVNTAWHPNCFVCKTCDELLVDLIYFFNKGDVYCGRHFAELLNIPRCHACDELIFVKEYTIAEEITFHVKHFCCYECDEPLAGKQYIAVDDQPVCLDCYQELFGKRCHTCKKQISAGNRRVGWKELNWHAVDECFRCYGCSKPLLGGMFVMQDEQPYCNKGCVC